MNGDSDADHKPLYCHWDTHVDDVLFNNEADLDRHIYGHFIQNSEDTNYLAPTPASPQPRPPEVPLSSGQTIECHWDACHELFEIDQIMQHLRDSHMQGSLHPHLHECQTAAQGCTLPSPKSEAASLDKPVGSDAYVRLNTQHDNLVPQSTMCDCHCDPNSSAGGSGSGSGGGSGGAGARAGAGAGAGLASCCSQRGLSQIDPGSLPSLQAVPSLGSTPGSDSASESYRCMWYLPNTDQCCGETFMTSPELHAHIAHTHVMEKPSSMCCCAWKGCPRDGKPFGQRQKLLRHLQTHAKTYEFKCRICSRPLSCESMRRMHERSHSNEKPFKCDICGRRFRANSGLIVHQRTHTGEKPLMCKFPGCNKRFAESSNLAKHMRTHQAKSFECEICNHKFTRKDHLIRHQKTRCRKNQLDSAAPSPGYLDNTLSTSSSQQHQQHLQASHMQMPGQMANQMPPPVQPSFMYAVDGSGNP